MNNKKILLLSIFSILLLLFLTITGTYAVIIDVVNEDGEDKIINIIHIKDLLINDDGSWNNTYYDIKNEVPLTDDEASLLMNSEPLNEKLQTVLKTIVQYRLHNNSSARLSNDEIYNLIEDGLNKTPSISDELRLRVLNKVSKYKSDISDYVYDTEVRVLTS